MNLTEIFESGKIVWFYYDSECPCQKGKIIEYIESEDNTPACYKIKWIYSSVYNNNKFEYSYENKYDEYEAGTSSVLVNKVFSTEEECLNYCKKISEKNKNDIRERINNKEELLKFMFECIGTEDYSFHDEKCVISEKIYEYFGIKIDK